MKLSRTGEWRSFPLPRYRDRRVNHYYFAGWPKSACGHVARHKTDSYEGIGPQCRSCTRVLEGMRK